MKTGVQVFVRGVVQDVSFRYHTKVTATKLGVFGWVRNLPDGRVEAVFEGEQDAVEKMVEFCKTGPWSAIVQDVVVKEEGWSGKYTNFEIKR